ncbi:hypothetical protein [Vibrio vulnificus]|jgi:hypothetical protein|uniref:hypothetical protein n=1 Tax=Vibrio vulnificus TaxID=672 RepID=UPI001CDD6649|nr:hypothetical protein [Vibrio vulnificus]MCA3928081.1 hypothetical protein [Vibrio vulnificus]
MEYDHISAIALDTEVLEVDEKLINTGNGDFTSLEGTKEVAEKIKMQSDISKLFSS